MPQISFLNCNIYVRNAEIHNLLYMLGLLYLAYVVLFGDSTMKPVNSVQPTGPETGNPPLYRQQRNKGPYKKSQAQRKII